MDSGDIVAAVSVAELVRITEVDETTARRWKSGRARIPAAAARLVALYVTGDLASLAGPDWAGWIITRDGLLQSPRWRRGFARWEIEQMPALHGQRATFDVERRQLQRDLQASVDELEEQKKRAAFYRAQLVAEARLGLAFLAPR